jgi:uncharacterized protein
LKEELRSEPDTYIAIVAHNGAKGELDTSAWDGQIVAEHRSEVSKGSKDLNFIPYYLRANRGGSGQMRVGLRVL